MRILKIGSVGFVVNLTTEWTIPIDAELSVNVLRPDNELFVIPAIRVDEQVAQITTTADMYGDDGFVMAGAYRVELVAEFADKRLVSQTGIIKVAGLAA